MPAIYILIHHHQILFLCQNGIERKHNCPDISIYGSIAEPKTSHPRKNSIYTLSSSTQNLEFFSLNKNKLKTMMKSAQNLINYFIYKIIIDSVQQLSCFIDINMAKSLLYVASKAKRRALLN